MQAIIWFMNSTKEWVVVIPKQTIIKECATLQEAKETVIALGCCSWVYLAS